MRGLGSLQNVIALCLAPVLPLVFALTGCSLIPGVPRVVAVSTPTGEQVAENVVPFYHQVLEWYACEATFQCATAVAPLDWTNPDQGTINLALIRHRPEAEKPLGSLLVNPGGPGASGFDVVAQSLDYVTDTELQQAFDVVGFDPRGVDRSAPVTCLDARGMDAYLYDIPEAARGTDEWITEQEKTASDFAQACQANTGSLLGHVDTVSVAHDLDMIRAALGDSRLNYLGYSYGTSIGSHYAKMFPQTVGRMVLDGAIDPALSSFDMTIAQAQGFENALRAYLADCLASETCLSYSSVDEGMTAIRQLLDRVDEHPLRASDGRLLGGNTLVTAIIFPLYQKASWPALTDMLASVSEGNAESAFELADQYNGRSLNGTYEDNSTNAFIAVNCLDYRYDDNRELMRQQAERIEAAAPVIGRYMSYGDIQCAEWTARSTSQPQAVSAENSAPVLVIGTTNDPATPYQWAQRLADQLANSRLLSYHGEGHTAYNKSNSCVNNVVDSYLIRGDLPSANVQC